MKVNINNISIVKTQNMTWNTLAEARYYEIYKDNLKEEGIIDSTIETEIDELIDTIRNSVYSFNMITALYSLNKLKHLI